METINIDEAKDIILEVYSTMGTVEGICTNRTAFVGLGVIGMPEQELLEIAMKKIKSNNGVFKVYNSHHYLNGLYQVQPY